MATVTRIALADGTFLPGLREKGNDLRKLAQGTFKKALKSGKTWDEANYMGMKAAYEAAGFVVPGYTAGKNAVARKGTAKPTPEPVAPAEPTPTPAEPGLWSDHRQAIAAILAAESVPARNEMIRQFVGCSVAFDKTQAQAEALVGYALNLRAGTVYQIVRGA